jgi:hypothetical protein
MSLSHTKTVAGLAATLLLQAQAFATQNYNTTTVVGTTYAYGALHDARNNANSHESLGCGFYAYTGAAVSAVFCTATAPNGTTSYNCSFYNPSDNIVKLALGLNEASYLFFEGDTSGNCTFIEVVQNSGYL